MFQIFCIFWSESPKVRKQNIENLVKLLQKSTKKATSYLVDSSEEFFEERSKLDVFVDYVRASKAQKIQD